MGRNRLFAIIGLALLLEARAEAAPEPTTEPATGLDRPFPPLSVRPENPTTPEKVELGRLLFFDPLLSGDQHNSCAHCHHPDLGLSDGLPRGRGWAATGAGASREGGVELPRGTPTLWNAAYSARLFWDGRARDLEDQATNPLTNMEEMGISPGRLVPELEEIPEYAALFAKAFPDPAERPVSFRNVVRAIAAFERTLLSRDSRFDRFAAGDREALTPTEKRGLRIFLSTETRCSECHALPTFSSTDFKVIGVPEPLDFAADQHHDGAEAGRGGPEGAFKVPTLRNVARTSPYMHSGIFKTLGEVVDFYAEGGGRGKGLPVPRQDEKVRKFKITPEEKGDLIAFLEALTDESSLPEFPVRVPSGLPVVERVPHPAARNAGVPAHPPLPVEGKLTIEVRPGESIQEAVDRVGRGGTVLVHPGLYRESVLVIDHGVTIRAVARNVGERPVIDGEGTRRDGIIALGNRLAVEGLEIRRTLGNALVARGVKGVALRDLEVSDPGLYGLYTVECDGVAIERCRVSGARDAAIYVGQSRAIVVRGCEAFGNVTGIEIENSRDALVEGNHVHGNTGGILVFLLPNNPSKVAEGTRVARNRVLANNLPNFADPRAIVHEVRRGTGILVLAADRTDVEGNEVRENSSVGIAVAGLQGLFPDGRKLDVDPNPDRNRVRGNVLAENGRAPDERQTAAGLPGRDLIWDGAGVGNEWDQPGASSQPERLPGR